MKSLDVMVKQCEGLVDTTGVSDWENGFLTHVVAIVSDRGTKALTTNQVASLTQIYERHFA